MDNGEEGFEIDEELLKGKFLDTPSVSPEKPLTQKQQQPNLVGNGERKFSQKMKVALNKKRLMVEEDDDNYVKNLGLEVEKVPPIVQIGTILAPGPTTSSSSATMVIEPTIVEHPPTPKRVKFSSSQEKDPLIPSETNELLGGIYPILDSNSTHVPVFMLLRRCFPHKLEDGGIQLFGDAKTLTSEVNRFILALMEELPHSELEKKMSSAIQVCVHVIGTSRSQEEVKQKFRIILEATGFMHNT
jgi:hypothetical protein